MQEVGKDHDASGPPCEFGTAGTTLKGTPGLQAVLRIESNINK